MPASKLRSLIILLLVSVCLLLLSLAVPQLLQERNSQIAMNQQLESLFASYGLALDAESIPMSRSLSLLELNLDANTDLTPVTALLGEQILALEDSTRYASAYSSSRGQCQVQRGGGFRAELSSGAAGSDLVAVTRQVLSDMAIEAAYISQPERLAAGIYEVRVVQQLQGVPNFSTELFFQYENNTLVAVSGTLFLGTGGTQGVEGETCLSATDALVRLLSSRNDLGWVGNSVISVRQGYVHTETASASLIRFTPVWLIETDTGYFSINGITGEVSNAKPWI